MSTSKITARVRLKWKHILCSVVMTTHEHWLGFLHGAAKFCKWDQEQCNRSLNSVRLHIIWPLPSLRSGSGVDYWEARGSAKSTTAFSEHEKRPLLWSDETKICIKFKNHIAQVYERHEGWGKKSIHCNIAIFCVLIDIVSIHRYQVSVFYYINS